MKALLTLTISFLLCFPAFSSEDFDPVHLEVLRDWLSQSDDVIEVSFFKRDWKAPKPQFPKGIATLYGRVTRVHRGTFRTGDLFMMTILTEFEKREVAAVSDKEPDSTSIVEGDIYVVITNKSETELTEGYFNNFDSNFRFLITSDFYTAFKHELELDPQLRGRPAE